MMSSASANIDEVYSKAYKEVMTILKELPLDEYNKIPKDMINMFEANMSSDYSFEFDSGKSYEEQNFLEETEAIIYNIYRDYLATAEERKVMQDMQKVNNELSEIEKESKYSSTDIFKKESKENVSEKKEVVESSLPVEVKSEGIIVKFIKFIKSIFKKK